MEASATTVVRGIMNDVDRATEHADEAAMARLLSMAGPRAVVPSDRAARVRAAVHRQWQVRSRWRSARRQVAAACLLLAAAAAVVLLAGRFNTPRPVVPVSEQVAVVDRVEGAPQRVTDGQTQRIGEALSAGDAIRTGESIVTDSRARAGLRFADGTSIRLDVDSRVRPIASTSIELSAGAVYVDTGGESGRFEVRTAIATARDLGTQFEVRLMGQALRLRVRTGVVELTNGARKVSGGGGTEVLLSPAGAMSQAIAVHGPAWEWIVGMGPRIEIEGMKLSALVERIAREHGWGLRYADPSLAREASQIVLHGSATGLAPREVLDVVMTTSGLQHRLEDGALVVFRRARRTGGEP